MRYDLAMANLPAITTQNAVPAANEELVDRLGDLIHSGVKPNEIARRLAPNDPDRRKYWRTKIRRLLQSDARLAARLADNAKIEMMTGLGPATVALTRKARAGRVDAIKLLFEASGLHNPRVQHEHSGEVNIKVSIPRPDVAKTHAEDPIVDADVVDDP